MENMLTRGVFWFKNSHVQFTVSLIAAQYVLPRETWTSLFKTWLFEVSRACPKSIKFVVLLLAIFKTTKKSFDRFTCLVHGLCDSSWSWMVESESDSCPVLKWISFSLFAFFLFFRFFFFFRLESTHSLYSNCWSLNA